MTIHTTTNERTQQLSDTLRYIEKKHGKGVVMRLGQQNREVLPVLSTGSLSLNQALGIGGIPRGRIIEIYGPPSSGKTTLAMHCIAEVQQQGGTTLLIDSEHAFDATYAAALGLDIDSLLVCQPDYGEQALDVAEQLIKSNALDLVVIDSVSALVPEAEVKGDMGAQHVGSQARLMSQAMRKLTGITHKTGVACIFINQLRQKIGVLFGSPETTSGGNALKFYASIRLDIRRITTLKNKEQEPIGHRAKIKVVKNKLSPPFKEAQLDMYYGKGISKTSEIIDLSLSLGLIQQSGAWYAYGEQKIGQGKEAVRQKLEEDIAWRERLTAQIQEAIQPSS